jgi:hypothetical protein
VRKISLQRKFQGVVDLPARTDSVPPKNTGVAGIASYLLYQRYDLLASYLQNGFIPVEPLRMVRPAQLLPIELARAESLLRPGIGDPFALLRICKLRKACEFFTSTLAHELSEFTGKITEKWKGSPCAPFLPHKQHRNLRKQQVHGSDRANRFRWCYGLDAITKSTVPDLVVVLYKALTLPSECVSLNRLVLGMIPS